MSYILYRKIIVQFSAHVSLMYMLLKNLVTVFRRWKTTQMTYETPSPEGKSLWHLTPGLQPRFSVVPSAQQVFGECHAVVEMGIVQPPVCSTLLGVVEIFLVGGSDQSGGRMRRAKRQDAVDDFYGQIHVCDEMGVVDMQFNFQRMVYGLPST